MTAKTPPASTRCHYTYCTTRGALIRCPADEANGAGRCKTHGGGK